METLEDKEETNVDKLTCDFCFKQYKERTGLWRHKKNCYKQLCKTTNINNLATTDDILATKSNILSTINNNLFKCEFCNKEYQHRQGLWKHNKNCKTKQNSGSETEEIKKYEPSEKETIDKDSLIIELLKQNKELLEIVKNGTTSNSHNTTNSHNKAFNLNFFLNETCKDAMNIMDFVESVKVKLADLEKIGEIGYVDGISNIIVENLNALDETKRPVHCTDTKREILYIKDNNKWEKEDEDKNKLRKVIKKIAYKNQRLLPEFKKEHPDCGKYHSKYSDQYNKLIVESMGGSGNNDLEKEDKIIKKISKEVTINKSNF